MKLKCNVCVGPIVTLPEPTEGELILCPNCGKQMALGVKEYRRDADWVIIDGEFNHEFGNTPVQVIEN